MIFFKFLNFPLKSSEIPVGLRFQLASVTINFTDNRDYRAVLYSMVGMLVLHWLLGIIMYSVKTSAMTVKAPRQHACAIHLWLCWVCKTRHGGEEVRGGERLLCCICDPFRFARSLAIVSCGVWYERERD